MVGSSIGGAVRQIKDDPFSVLHGEVIEGVCKALNYHWRRGSDGPLDPAHTVALFVQQVAEGNVSCAAVRHLSDRAFSASAYCQARQRLPLEVLRELSRRVARAAREVDDQQDEASSCRWHGHAVWIVDGSTFSMPDTPELQQHFGQPAGQAAGCGFPVAHLLTLFRRGSGMMEEPVVSPLYTADLWHTPRVHAQMEAGDVLLGDQSFGSWAHFALVLRAQLHLVTPSLHNRIVRFNPCRRRTRHGQRGEAGLPRTRWVRSLGKHDQLVEWFKPDKCPDWMKPSEYDALPGSIVVREIRRTIKRKGFRPMTVTVVTTLLDAQRYPADEVVSLRRQRWQVETDLRHLKTTMGMDVLHCKSVEGVNKEVAVFVLVYNLVRTLMLAAARGQQVPVERISFADALAWLRHAEAGDELAALVVNPQRPGRVEPRAVKRRPKPYDLLNRPRQELRNALRQRKKAG